MRRNLLAVGMALGLMFVPAWTAWAKKVAVVVSRTLAPYQEVLQGIRQETKYEVLDTDIAGNLEAGNQLMAAMSGKGIDGVITIGSEALKAAKANLHPQIPLIYTMLLEAPDLAGRKAAGVLSRISVEEQFSRIRKLLPQVVKIGALYNPEVSAAIANQARQAAEKSGLTLMLLTAVSLSDVSNGLEKMKEMRVDLIWSILDPVIANPASMQELIKFTLENKIPFVALSEMHVRAGALAAFSVDYQDIGAQTAILAAQILEGGAAGESQSPRRNVLYINDRVQKNLGLALPPLPDLRIIE